MEKRRVVITGMGAVTPVGNHVSAFWEAIRQGKCGIGLRRGILAERLEASFFLNKNPRSHKRNGGSCLSEGNSSNGYSKSTFIENEPSFTFIRYSRGDIPKVSRKALEKWE